MMTRCDYYDDVRGMCGRPADCMYTTPLHGGTVVEVCLRHLIPANRARRLGESDPVLFKYTWFYETIGQASTPHPLR